MSRDCFSLLCDQIKSNVGEHVFRSEAYLHDLYRGRHIPHPDDGKYVRRMMNLALAARAYQGDFISGEVKVALILRLLAGGSYLDLSLIFETNPSYALAIFHQVIRDWILDDRLVKINGMEYCQDEARMNEVALQFARGSGGVIGGCIGAIDGWIVKIIRPSKRDNVIDPKSFYSRKGFHGISVQAIVDKNKRVLFRSIESRGAEHDSSAFKRTNLYKWLIDNWHTLRDKGYYFIGDSAYSLKTFLHTPYDNAVHGTAEDNYNYFHSSSRIVVECTFGEIDLRWGILWKPLHFSLEHNCKVIDACIRLHNFIIDYRLSSSDTNDSSYERSIFDDECRRFLAVLPDTEDEGGIHGGKCEVQRDNDFNIYRGGRPTKNETICESVAWQWRNLHRDNIARRRLVRPRSNWYRVNNRILN